jgi:integrase
MNVTKYVGSLLTAFSDAGSTPAASTISELLLAGVPLDQVSLLPGHKSIKTTERHYAPFVKARQEQLIAAVQRAWFKPKQKKRSGK